MHILTHYKICNKIWGHVTGLQKNKFYDFVPLRMPGPRVWGANHGKYEKSKNSF